MAGVPLPSDYGRGSGNLTARGAPLGHRTIRELLDDSAERAYALLTVANNVANGDTVSIGEVSEHASASAVQTITLTGVTGGTVVFTYKGQHTTPLAWNAATSVVQAAMQALSTVGSGNMTVGGVAGASYSFTFAGALANQPVPLITWDETQLTGTPNMGVGIAETTPGSTGMGITDVFVIDQITTNSGQVTTAGKYSLNNTHTQSDIISPSAALVVGDVIAVGAEMMRITRLYATSDVNGNAINVVAVRRGAGGTTIAAHADGSAILISAAPGTVAALPYHIITPLAAALTPAAYLASLAAALQHHDGGNGPSGTCTAIVLGANTLMLVASQRGPMARSLASNLGAGNAWSTTAMIGGQGPSIGRTFAGTHPISAADVTAGKVVIPFDFLATPSGYMVQLRTAAGVFKAWDGAVTFTAPGADPTPDIPGYMTATIGTGSLYAATDQLCYILVE